MDELSNCMIFLYRHLLILQVFALDLSHNLLLSVISDRTPFTSTLKLHAFMDLPAFQAVNKRTDHSCKCRNLQ